jgi:hypothetical protein
LSGVEPEARDQRADLIQVNALEVFHRAAVTEDAARRKVEITGAGRDVLGAHAHAIEGVAELGRRDLDSGKTPLTFGQR